MNVGKLKRVAIKEFKRSPAKTGFLLLMIPVALYFCVPLLFGALKKSSPSTSGATVAAETKTADFVLPTAVTPSHAERTWDEVARCLENDLLAVPASIPANARNPFVAKHHVKEYESPAVVEDGQHVELPETEDELAETVGQTAVASNPIRALGLELTATMVGQRSRLATINGKTYQEGARIPVSIDSDLAAESSATMPLTLAQVDRRFVVLEMAGHQLRLQLRNEISQDVIVVKSSPE